MPKYDGNRPDSSQSEIALRNYQQSLIQGVYGDQLVGGQKKLRLKGLSLIGYS